MAALSQVPIAPSLPERFRAVLGDDYSRFEEAMASAGPMFAGRVIWHVNSTARGGGVAELLQSLLAYTRGAGIDARWVTIGADGSFFRITKRMHNHLHGAEGDGGELGATEKATYERTLARSAEELIAMVDRRDIVYLHDPQTAGLTRALRSVAGHVVWRCHVGLDNPNELARRAWEFLLPYVEEADAYVFSRRAFAWDGLDDGKLWIVAPSIDAFSAKNQEIGPEAVRAILARTGLTQGAGGGPAVAGGGPAVFVRQNGSPGRVDRAAELDQEAPIPDDAPLVAQVSRWDRLKDPSGVLRCFADRCRHPGAHLLLAGPSVAEVADDPEGAQVLAEIRAERAALRAELRERVHLASLPMDDREENAAIVNAIQRRADLVLQKSLAEGFGLTVAEAMWKARPVIASRIGGIQDQILDGESGLLIDPRDLGATAAAIDGLLDDPARARALGTAARERVRGSFLGTRDLLQHMELIGTLLSGGNRMR
jgi:trehalose synthase